MADIEVVIKIPKRVYNYIRKYEHIANSDVLDIKDAIINGTPLPKGHGRLIDADICLNKAWQNFYKQEDEHEKNIDGYDIMRDKVFEQSGFECCQQTIVNAPTIIEADKEQEDE